MIVELGQLIRDRRIGPTDPIFRTPIEEPELPADVPLTSKVIAELIAKHYESALGHDRIVSIRLADGEIRPDQRFYDREIELAAAVLAARSPQTESAQNWYVLMKNYMGYRIVTVPFCSYGEEPDPVTRQCIAKRPEIEPPIRERPASEGKPPETKTSSLILPLGIVGVVGLLMLGGQK